MSLIYLKEVFVSTNFHAIHAMRTESVEAFGLKQNSQIDNVIGAQYSQSLKWNPSMPPGSDATVKAMQGYINCGVTVDIVNKEVSIKMFTWKCNE